MKPMLLITAIVVLWSIVARADAIDTDAHRYLKRSLANGAPLAM